MPCRPAGPPRLSAGVTRQARDFPGTPHVRIPGDTDNTWASIGSDNVNLRSWSHDSELSCAVLDETLDPREPRTGACPGDHPRTYARDLRLELAREHLDRAEGDDADLCDPESAFRAFTHCAASLEGWHAAGRVGDRPPGRIRPYRTIAQSRWTKLWATPVYRHVFDPDGRPRGLRRNGSF